MVSIEFKAEEECCLNTALQLCTDRYSTVRSLVDSSGSKSILCVWWEPTAPTADSMGTGIASQCVCLYV